MHNHAIKIIILLWTISCVITRLASQEGINIEISAVPTMVPPTEPPLVCNNNHSLTNEIGEIEGPNIDNTTNEICEIWAISGNEGDYVILDLEFNNETLTSSDTIIIREGIGSQSEIIRFGETSTNTKSLKVASISSAMTVEYKGTNSLEHGSFKFQYNIKKEDTRQSLLRDPWGYVNVTGGEDYVNYQHTWLLDTGDRNNSIDIVIENSSIYDPQEKDSGFDFSPIFEPNYLMHTMVYGSYLSIGTGLSVLQESQAYMTSGKVSNPVRLKMARSKAYIYLYAKDFSLPDFGFYLTYNFTDLPQVSTVAPTTPSPYANQNYTVGILGLSKDEFVTSDTLPTLFQQIMVKYVEIYCNVDDTVLNATAKMSDIMLASNARKGSYVGFELGLTEICLRNGRSFDDSSLSEMLDIYGDHIESEFGHKVVMEFTYSKAGWIWLITATIVCTFIVILVIGMAKRKYHSKNYKSINHFADLKNPPAELMPERVDPPQHSKHVEENIYDNTTEFTRPIQMHKYTRHTTGKFPPKFKKRTQQTGDKVNLGYNHTEESITDEEVEVYSSANHRKSESIGSIENIYDTPMEINLDASNENQTTYI